MALGRNDICIYETQKHECCVLCKLQCSFTAVKSWYECWNLKMKQGKIQVIHFFRRLRVSDDIQLHGQYFLSINIVNVPWCHLQQEDDVEAPYWTVAKALCTYIRTYSLFKSRHLSTNIKLTLYKALIRSVMTYACPTLEYVVDAHILKLLRLQNRVLCATANLDRCTPDRKLCVSLKISYEYDYIIKLCRTCAEVILNHVNPNVYGIGKGEARHRKCKRLKLGGGEDYNRPAD
jgi:hypothetical protein